MSEEAIYKLHKYPSGELEEFEQVQKLVRCKECTYWNTDGCRDGVGECEWAYYMTNPDDFCSYGERKESE